MRPIVFFLMLFITFSTKAQNLNEYKYVIVPESFDFSKEPNEHQLNALTKFLFEKYGFKTLMKKEQRPEDLRKNNCLALEADVKNNSGLFVTKLVVTLEDCHGKVVFESKEGRSREKAFKDARHEALRDAFTSVEALNYEYNADPVVETTNGNKEEPEPVEEPEVAVEAPEESKKEELAGREIEEAGEQPWGGDPSESFAGKTYQRNNNTFLLGKNEDGLAIFRKGMDEPFALLIASEKEGNYIYNSLSRQGMAYFTSEGDLVVEYFDGKEKGMVKLIYELQD